MNLSRIFYTSLNLRTTSSPALIQAAAQREKRLVQILTRVGTPFTRLSGVDVQTLEELNQSFPSYERQGIEPELLLGRSPLTGHQLIAPAVGIFVAFASFLRKLALSPHELGVKEGDWVLAMEDDARLAKAWRWRAMLTNALCGLRGLEWDLARLGSWGEQRSSDCVNRMWLRSAGLPCEPPCDGKLGSKFYYHWAGAVMLRAGSAAERVYRYFRSKRIIHIDRLMVSDEIRSYVINRQAQPIFHPSGQSVRSRLVEKRRDTTQAAMAAVAVHGALPSVRLFCFTVARPAELPLLRTHEEVGGGIFGCDDWAVFSNASIPGFARGRHFSSMIRGSMDVPKGGNYTSALNGELFVQVWRKLPEYLSGRAVDWIVKVDADTCFSAAPLRSMILGAAPAVKPNSEPYVWAIEVPDDEASRWTPGPLVVLSTAGLSVLHGVLDFCSLKADPRSHGEDLWLMWCLSGWLTRPTSAPRRGSNRSPPLAW